MRLEKGKGALSMLPPSLKAQAGISVLVQVSGKEIPLRCPLLRNHVNYCGHMLTGRRVSIHWAINI